MYRAARHWPWWFCTCGNCRFDLDPGDDPPFGTLYAGTDEVTGMLETIGPELAGRAVARRFLSERTVWALAYDRPLELADLVSPGAVGFGVTNELSTMVPYDVPQQWATAFHHDGRDGVAYRTRFNTGPDATGLALFDDAGAHDDWVALAVCAGDADPILDALAERNIAVERPPRLADLDVR